MKAKVIIQQGKMEMIFFFIKRNTTSEKISGHYIKISKAFSNFNLFDLNQPKEALHINIILTLTP